MGPASWLWELGSEPQSRVRPWVKSGVWEVEGGGAGAPRRGPMCLQSGLRWPGLGSPCVSGVCHGRGGRWAGLPGF